MKYKHKQKNVSAYDVVSEQQPKNDQVVRIIDNHRKIVFTPNQELASGQIGETDKKGETSSIQNTVTTNLTHRATPTQLQNQSAAGQGQTSVNYSTMDEKVKIDNTFDKPMTHRPPVDLDPIVGSIKIDDHVHDN